MVDIVTRLGKGSPLTNAEVDANFTNLAEVSGVTGEPMGHEDRTTSTISFNASTRTFTIAPVASSFTVWCKGKKVVVSTAQTVTIPNTTGMYSIYYDANGVLSAKSGYFTFSLEAPTAYVYWNAATGTAPYFGDERHGVVLDWQTHEYLHRTRGAALASGFSASGYVLGGNGSLNSHAQLTIEGGTFFDEDMKIIVTATNTPTAGTWEQDLTSPARIPVLYLSGTAWVIDSPTDYPLKQGTARPQYNAYSGGVWSTADVTNNKYATSWILATNNLTYPVIAIIGQAQSDSQSDAEAVDFTELQLPGFPSVEFRPLYKLIFQCADSCTNAVHASLVSITDIRSIAAAGTAASIVTDHGNLSGLSDDDHPQYIHVDTLRTVSAAVKASFLPSQTSNAGKFLQTDGTATSWQALTSGNVTTALGFTPYNATNPNGYITGISSSDVTTALGFTPYNATNPSGYVTAAGARGAISVTGAGSYDSATGVINIVGGVTSFNTRTGAITLSSADVTTALGFTPYNNTNPSGYITGITSTMVTTALGYTPYNSSNPNGYISSITSANVTTALGFTPYNATNPSGYITSSALSGYLTSASAASTYLPLSGGTVSGQLVIGAVGTANSPTLRLNTSSSGAFVHTQETFAANLTSGQHIISVIGKVGSTKNSGYIGYTWAGDASNSNYVTIGHWGNDDLLRVYGDGNVTVGTNTVLHAGNYNSYALPLSGGTLTGVLNISNGDSSYVTFGPNSTYSGSLRVGTGVGPLGLVSGRATIYSDNGNLKVDAGTGQTLYLNQHNGGGTVYIGGTTNYIIHTGNYNSFAPTLTGGGASGTWGISITGSAASVSGLTPAQFFNNMGNNHGTYTDFNNVPGFGAYYVQQGGNSPTGTGSHQWYGFTLGLGNEYPLSQYGTQITWPRAAQNSDTYIYVRDKESTSWGSWRKIRAGFSDSTSRLYSTDSAYNYNAANPYYGYLTYNGTANRWRFKVSPATPDAVEVAYADSAGSVSGGLTTSNYSSYALPLSGGSLSGDLQLGGNYLRFDQSGTRSWNMRATGGNLDLNSGDGAGSFRYNGYTVVHANNPQITTEWYHSDRDFPSGTLITTNINYAVTYGDPFVLEIRGNSYGNIVPLDLQYQGYIYNDTIINHGGLSNGLMIQGLVAINNGGNLCFWFPTQGYWNGYNVKVYAAYATRALNRVTSITGGGKPTTAKEVALTANIRQSLNSGNYTSYSPTLTGTGASGTWSISITGTAGAANSATSAGYLTGGDSGFYGLLYNTLAGDLNTYNSPGLYSAEYTGSTNKPSGVTNGHVIQISDAGGTDVKTQWYFPSAGVTPYMRLMWGNTSWNPWIALLTSSNYNSYAPTLTGGGASGTWGINISGASDRTYRGIIEDTRAGQRSPNAYDDYRAHFEFTDQIVGDWHTAFTMQGWHDGYSAWQIIGPASTSAHENWYLRSGVNTSWNSVRTILHSGNYSSYSPPYSGGTLSGTWYFNTSAGSTSGALASPALQAYSTGNNAAWFSWHKAGHYAVNMGLDSDNVLRIGGWSASANRWQLDMSGNMTVAGNVTAYSDERLKKDWAPVRSGFVEALASIKSGTYTRIDSEERQAGVSAQDWQKLLPETVSTDNEGTLSLAYGNAALVSAVELAKEVVDLRTRVAQLESLINKLIGD